MNKHSKSAKRTPKWWRSDRRLLLWGILSFVTISALAGWVFADWYRIVPESEQAQFVGRDTCIECHQAQNNLFHGSHHDLAMDVANEKTVLADFNNQSLEHYGLVSKFYRDGERYMVRTEGADGELDDFEVKYVFGVEPLQQYMVELKPANKPDAIGTVQVLRLSWDTVNKKWFYLRPPDVDEKLEPGDRLHWTSITQNWNSSCAFCHSTNVQKNFDVATQTFNTTFSEIDVSCEACHGPGSIHVNLAKKKHFFWDRKRGLALHKLKSASNVPQVETCAACHSRRREIADGYVAGCNFNDYFDPAVMQPRLYHCDGQIRDEVYVYGSFVQSKMYHNNIKCTDCHDPHSAKVKFQGNKLCTSCHQHPAAKYDSPSHHFHKPGSPGSQCVECHMPATTYMGVDARRDHSLRVPRPDLSLTTSAPNSCTGCHLQPDRIQDTATRAQLNQYLDWIILRERGNKEVQQELARVDQLMAEAVKKWYPASDLPPNYGPAFDQVDKNPASAAKTLTPLLGSRTVPAFFRGSAALQLVAADDRESLNAALVATNDVDPMVVKASILRIESEMLALLGLVYADRENDESRQLAALCETVGELTKHSSRMVRIEAARAITSLPPLLRTRYLSHDLNDHYVEAFDELIDSHLASRERGTSHAALAELHELNGNELMAARHYRVAIALEPSIQGPRWRLAAMLETRAEAVQREAMQLIQSSPEIAREQSRRAVEIAREALELRKVEHGILLTSLKQLEGLAPTHLLHYQLGMSYYNLGNLEKTEYHLAEAYRQHPRAEQYVVAMATFYHAQKDRARALKFVTELLELYPRNPGYQQLKAEIEQL